MLYAISLSISGTITVFLFFYPGKIINLFLSPVTWLLYSGIENDPLHSPILWSNSLSFIFGIVFWWVVLFALFQRISNKKNFNLD
jgi:uncharacterized protein with PQ loop repeat